MPDLVSAPGGVDAARTAVAVAAQQVRALTDPLGPAPAAACGGLLDGGLGDAIDGLRAALRTDLTAAGDRLAALERALDATERSLHDSDRRAAASLAPGR